MIDSGLDTNVDGGSQSNHGEHADEGEEAHVDGVKDSQDDAKGNAEEDAQQQVRQEDSALVALGNLCTLDHGLAWSYLLVDHEEEGLRPSYADDNAWHDEEEVCREE